MPYFLLSLVPLRSTFHGKVPWGTELANVARKIPGISPIANSLIPFVSRMFDKYSPFDTWMWGVLEDLHAYTTPWRLINRYAKFGSMSTWRGELIIQGSDDKEHWESYEFKYKPGDINKRPPFIPGHLPGLDWRIWFLPTPVLKRGINGLPDWYFALLQV